jgi:uncharacterized membrane protein
MINTKLLVGSALAAMASLAASATIAQSGPAAQPEYSFEKCFGVVKAGNNDCQTSTHSCAGTSTADNQGDAWIYLPAGACAKLTTGSTEPKAS